MEEWEKNMNGGPADGQTEDPRAQAEKAIQEARAAEMARQQQELREREQQLIDAYRLQQEARERQIKEAEAAREEARLQAEAAARAAAEQESAEKKARKKMGFKIAGICLAVLVLVSGVGLLAGSLFNRYRAMQEENEQYSREAEEAERRQAEENRQRPTEPAEESATRVPETKNTSPSVIARESREAGSLNVALTDVSDIVADALPSVVSIEVTAMVTSFYRQYETQGAGSGIIIGENGDELWIVTNHHVIEDANAIAVVFCDGKRYEAYLKGTSQADDLAVLGIKLENIPKETLDEIRIIRIGDSDTLKLGQGVIAIGNAMGWGQSVTTGVVSGLNREVTFSDGTKMYLLQTSAAINPGNSGGALLNSSGELIGINNSKYSDTDVEGVGFAIPISSVKEIMAELSLKEPRLPVSEADFPYLGATFKDLSSSYMQAYGMPTGAFVYEVGEKSPAAEAGLLSYDIITKLDDVTIIDYQSLVDELQYHTGGSTVTLTVMRLNHGRYEEKQLSVTLGYKKDYN